MTITYRAAIAYRAGGITYRGQVADTPPYVSVPSATWRVSAPGRRWRAVFRRREP